MSKDTREQPAVVANRVVQEWLSDWRNEQTLGNALSEFCAIVEQGVCRLLAKDRAEDITTLSDLPRFLRRPSKGTVDGYNGAESIPIRGHWWYGQTKMMWDNFACVHCHRRKGVLEPTEVDVLVGKTPFESTYSVAVVLHDEDGECHQWDLEIPDLREAEGMGDFLLSRGMLTVVFLTLLGFTKILG